MAFLCPILAVGAVIWRDPKHLLLVRRGQPPLSGEWSIPGGRVERGETLTEALRREVLEETGLTVRLERLIDVVDFIQRTPSGDILDHFVLVDFSARWSSGEPRAGSDITDCRWFRASDALRCLSWEETRRVIRLSSQHLWSTAL